MADEPSLSHKFKQTLIKKVERKDYRNRKFKDSIYQNIYFTRDDDDVLIQVSDLIAYTISKYVKDCTKEIPLDSLARDHDFGYNLERCKYFRNARPIFQFDSKTRVDGWGIKVWN